MLADARELVGDLTVASVELAEERGDRERWLRLAIATAAAVRAQSAPPDLLAALAGALDRGMLRAIRGFAEDVCERGTDWERACTARSGIEAIRDLFESRFFDELDPSHLERSTIARGEALYRPLAVPEDIPPWHWWWTSPVPPNEHTLRVNERMRALLPEWHTIPPATDLVSPKFRRLVADDFTNRDGNVLLADVLQADPSRRPVDVAAAALACARHLAYELERRRRPRCRIVLVISAVSGYIAFHRVRPDEGPIVGFDRPPAATLVVDSRP